MTMLPSRLALICLGAASAISFVSQSAQAGGNASLFSAGAGIFSAAQSPMDLPRRKPLLYSDAEPAKVKAAPDQIFLAKATPRYSNRDLGCLAEALYFGFRWRIEALQPSLWVELSGIGSEMVNIYWC